MAYALLALALESERAALSPKGFFAHSISNLLNLHTPLKRYHEAGRAFRASGGSASRLEALLRHHVQLDLNPFVQCMAASRSEDGALAIHAEYNRRAKGLTIRTEIRLGFGGKLELTKRERSSSSGSDPTVCQDAHLVAMDAIVSAATQSEPRPRTLGSLAEGIGLGETVGLDVAAVFDHASRTTVDAMGRELGCHPRTLQRQLRREGLSLESVKRASMLLKATSMLSGSATLTQIAYEAGYSDQAHMTRSFVASCSLPPSLLRSAMKTGDRERLSNAGKQ